MQNARIWEAARDETASRAFKARAIDWPTDAVKIPTESHDDMQPVGSGDGNTPGARIRADAHLYCGGRIRRRGGWAGRHWRACEGSTPHVRRGSFAVIRAGMIETFGAVVAFPDVVEKGYLNVVVEVTSPGGFSSVPPDHTTIGILAIRRDVRTGAGAGYADGRGRGAVPAARGEHQDCVSDAADGGGGAVDYVGEYGCVMLLACLPHTRYYWWKLSRHIFRYGHGNSAGVGPDEILNTYSA
ncbi:hypothetical protein C8R46DRAFT_1066532 [Mycena filopes]|nr:hypothetical protein C8R46DRAFT_1066532 [Mycena filopes]